MLCNLLSPRWRRYLQRRGTAVRARGGDAGAPALLGELLDLTRGDGNPLAVVDSGQRVTLRHGRGFYLTAGPDGVLSWTDPEFGVGVPQQFQIVKTAGTGRINDGDEVALRTYSGLPGGPRKWVAMEESGRVIADRDRRGDWERFVFHLPPEIEAFVVPQPTAEVIPTPAQAVEATIVLGRPAPSGGVPVLVSGPPRLSTAARFVEVPVRVVVPEGSTSGTFAIQLEPMGPCLAEVPAYDFPFSVVPEWAGGGAAAGTRQAKLKVRSRRDSDERIAISFPTRADFGATIAGTVTLRGTARATGPIAVTAEPDALVISATASPTVLSPESDHASFSVKTRSSGTRGCAIVTVVVPFGLHIRGFPETRPARVRLPVWVGGGDPE